MILAERSDRSSSSSAFHLSARYLYNARVLRAPYKPMHQTQKKSLEQVVEECGRFPIEAFEFVRHGLNHTVQQIHGDTSSKPDSACHVSGAQLSWGLRNYAVARSGVVAKTVLNHWGIHRTSDFGKIVFAMVESKIMQKTDDDDVRDFEGVFDFEAAFNPPVRPETRPTTVFEI